MVEQFAMQALRGVVLSDGSLALPAQNAFFYIGLSDNREDLVQREQIPIEELLAFLWHLVTTVLVPLGVEPCSGHPKIRLYKKPGVDSRVPGVVLKTRVSELLTGLYSQYYYAGKKIVPEGIPLTNISLAYLYMLDGNSSWEDRGGPAVSVYLCTQGFDLHSVELLEKQLHNFDINTGRAHTKGGDSKIEITILQNSVDCFMSIVEPYMVPPYVYKVKRRRKELVE